MLRDKNLPVGYSLAIGKGGARRLAAKFAGVPTNLALAAVYPLRYIEWITRRP